MAGTVKESVKGTVILRSVPSGKIEAQIAEYLAEVYGDISISRIAGLLSRTKPITIIKDVPRENGNVIAERINGMGASAYFLQYLGSVAKH